MKKSPVCCEQSLSQVAAIRAAASLNYRESSQNKKKTVVGWKYPSIGPLRSRNDGVSGEGRKERKKGMCYTMHGSLLQG
jgi:hypothetical protein